MMGFCLLTIKVYDGSHGSKKENLSNFIHTCLQYIHYNIYIQIAKFINFFFWLKFLFSFNNFFFSFAIFLSSGYIH